MPSGSGHAHAFGAAGRDFALRVIRGPIPVVAATWAGAFIAGPVRW